MPITNSSSVGADRYGGLFTGKVATESGLLNVRNTASTDAAIITTLAHNSTGLFAAQHLGDAPTYARAWLLHYPQGNNAAPDGYVSAKFISWIPSYGTGGCTSTTVKVTPSEYVNLRQTPSTSATSIYRLHNGDSVLMMFERNFPVSNWTFIATAGGTGWIKTNFLN